MIRLYLNKNPGQIKFLANLFCISPQLLDAIFWPDLGRSFSH